MTASDFPTLMPLPADLFDGSRGRRARYAIGVDGGATKTLATLFDVHERRNWFGRAGPSNADAVGRAAAVAAIEAAVRAALAEASVEAAGVGVAVAGIAGTGDPELAAELTRRLGLGRVYVVNDVVTAWAAGTACEPGVVVISGTGSHVFGVNGAGDAWRAGGWGHILGDQGSAYWLGLEALKAALAYRDASGEPTELMGRAERTYALSGVEELPGLVYGKPLTKGEIAAFAREVADAATAGDAVARALFERAGRDLGRQVSAVVGSLGLASDRFPVALVGSVFRSGPLIRDPLERAIAEVAPSAEPRSPRLPPVAGAALLAVLADGAGRADADALVGALEALPCGDET